MSRKGKKRAKAKYRQPMRPAGPLTPSAGSGGAAGTSAPTRTVQQARAGGDSAMGRAGEMSRGPRHPNVKGRGGRLRGEAAGPSIPPGPVPYLTQDPLRPLVGGPPMGGV